MTVTLAKGGNLVLASEAPGIQAVRICLGWSIEPGSAAVEIDGLVSLVEDSSPAPRLLLAHAVPNPDEGVTAPPATGPVVGDAEKLVVTLAAVPPSVARLQFGAAIYDAAGRRQTFRSVRDAYVRIVNQANGIEIVRYTLEQETGSETAMLFGELYRNPRGWKFRAVGQGYAAGVRGIGGGTGDPATARPVDVVDYMRRTSAVRSRRSLAEHLHPPRATPPARPSAAPSRPTRSTPPARPPSTPSPPTPPTSRPQPASAQPAPTRPPEQVRPTSRSMLDLSGTSEPTPSPAAPAPARTSLSAPARSAPAGGSAPSSSPAAASGNRHGLVYGEHSSRYRQRQEHVAALDDDHPATTWTAQDRGTGGMALTLRWEPLHTSNGLPRPSDLQLGCFWQAGDRSGGILQTLGNTISAPGASGSRQVLRLGRRDEREGQTIFVDLATLPTFRRFFVYAYGQHGSPEWAQLRPVLTVAAPSGEQLAIRLGTASPSARLCVVASFHVVGDDLVIRRENDFLDGTQADAARRYGWQLEWNPDGMTLRSPL